MIYLQVRFRHKIRKLVDGRSLVSARKHTLRLLRTGRFPLNKKRVIETIDPVGFAQIRKRYEVANPGADWPKYLDLDRWIGINIRRIRQVELDLARPRRILDLGCGAGYFLYIAQLLGHSGLGLDMDRLAMFREVTRLLGVRRVVQRIEAFRPLPDFGQKFDLITAHRVCFHRIARTASGEWSEWTPADWEFFINDIRTRFLKPGGRLLLDFNPKPFYLSRGIMMMGKLWCIMDARCT